MICRMRRTNKEPSLDKTGWTWCGTPLEKMTREELITALVAMTEHEKRQFQQLHDAYTSTHNMMQTAIDLRFHK
jgi:hypothetical protein